MTNRKLHTRFRLVPKSSTLDDLEWHWTAKTHSAAEKMRILEPTAQIWMKIDPYYQRQKCRPMILVSGNIRCMGIFAGVSLGGASNEWGCRRRQLLAIWAVTSLESSKIRPAILYGDMLPLIGRKLIAKWMTLNDLEWLFDVKIRFRPTLCCRVDASLGAHCTYLNEDRPILSGAKNVGQWLVSGNIRFMQIFAGVPLGRGIKRHWGLSTTTIFGDLGGYVFENFRDTGTTSNIIWRYAAPCRWVTDCKINDLEWSWVAISCQNPFSASTSWIRAFECQK